jgi:hypothetical protein
MLPVEAVAAAGASPGEIRAPFAIGPDARAVSCFSARVIGSSAPDGERHDCDEHRQAEPKHGRSLTCDGAADKRAGATAASRQHR